MQAFANQLNEEELAAVVTYERNAWGNDTGDAVQASDIKQVLTNGTLPDNNNAQVDAEKPSTSDKNATPEANVTSEAMDSQPEAQ